MSAQPHPGPVAAEQVAFIERSLRRHGRSLLLAEKRRRGIPRDRLLVVGLHHVADVWWCAERAVGTARERELGAFCSYLRDRLAYCMELGRIKSLPPRVADWLAVGRDLSPADAEALLSRREVIGPPPRRPFVAEARDGVLYIDPRLPPDKREVCTTWAERMGWQIASAEQQPRLHRAMARQQHGESYPSIRWGFDWGRLLLVGMPDGLADQFVYEMRITTADWVAMRFVKPVAMCQADLYGRFFNRTGKRVQLCVLATGRTHTIRGPVDRDLAERTLAIFDDVESGRTPPSPPAVWKCDPRRCDRFAGCVVRKNRTACPSTRNS